MYSWPACPAGHAGPLIPTTRWPVLTKSCRELRVPFEDANQAKIAANTLSPDLALRPQEFEVRYETKDSDLIVHFAGISARTLRVGVSSTIDSIKTILETIDELS